MDLVNINGFTLNGLSKTNVILGKNGCGKSYLLKRVEQGLVRKDDFGKIRYLSPERGGVLQYEAGIEQNIANDPRWIEDQRRRNQSGNFRQQSATPFRRLELLVLRQIEREHTSPTYTPRTFDATIEKMNKLLDRVYLERDQNKAFKILLRDNGNEAPPDQISSGESELISLGIEFLAFLNECEPDKENVLLVDEPDVHLHPDLQDRLANFIVDAFKDARITLILATHSTALLAALADREETRVAFMRRSDAALTFKPVSDTDKAILPIFGAHPLSNVFNQSPVLLIEGEDDERIWQQAVRSSGGKIRVYPCVVDGIGNFLQFETEVNNIVQSVYDDAKGYSLRDRDLQPEALDDLGSIVRMRLGCRAAENLMLTDDVLALAGTNWIAFKGKIEEWIKASAEHKYFDDLNRFADEGFKRREHDLKEIRNVLIGLMSNKPWEVLVGQSIAGLTESSSSDAEGSLRSFLGKKVCQQILKIGAQETQPRRFGWWSRKG